MEKMETIRQTQKPEVNAESFYALDIRYCKIENVEDILKNPKKEFNAIDNPVKAYKLTVDTGFDTRTIVTNLVQFKKEQLLGIITPFILNLPEATIRGVESKGMIFTPSSNNILIGYKIGEIIV